MRIYRTFLRGLLPGTQKSATFSSYYTLKSRNIPTGMFIGNTYADETKYIGGKYMKRHKYIANCNSSDIKDWDDFFQELKDKNYVAEEYEYNIISGKGAEKTEICAVLYGKENGITFMSIATHKSRRYRSSYTRSGHCKHNYTYVRIVYKLTAEGAYYIKGLLIEKLI